MAVQNTAEAIQLRAAVVIFWAIKRHTLASNFFCASTTVSAIDGYGPMKCFNISEDEACSTISRDRKNRELSHIWDTVENEIKKTMGHRIGQASRYATWSRI